MYNYFQLTLFLVLIGKFDEKSNFLPWLAWTRPYKSWAGPKQGESIVIKIWE